ncbi:MULTISPECIES: very short patch repair endonuclease [Alicyclobacillus]|uniref:very short patch repair endonuclease n=1 Tax=Alicyclobacillus TaxID=29330 RepID=UPI0009D6A410|nr:MULTISPECIES: very short patch repair endonuclease [Alicyclobacillus]
MTDNVSRQHRSEIMRAVRAKDTSLELMVRRAEWAKGVRFRVNAKDLPGKPYIAIKRVKLDIFIDSCFWDRCSKHGRIPKSNIEFWRNKIKRNMERDKKVLNQYQTMGWDVLHIWEHEIRDNLERVVDAIVGRIQTLRSNNGRSTIENGGVQFEADVGE